VPTARTGNCQVPAQDRPASGHVLVMQDTSMPVRNWQGCCHRKTSGGDVRCPIGARDQR
jgi:hypothetical protein